MIKVIHIINSLQSGGAENMLCKIIKYSDKEKYHHEIISLGVNNTLEGRIKDEGVKIHYLNLTGKRLIKGITEAKKIVMDFDVVDTWLYHSDIFGFFVGKLLKKKIIWNIRHSNLDKGYNKKTTMKIIRINSFLSKYVDCITFNSKEAWENHNKFGYCTKRARLVYNGFDLDVYKKSKKARADIRKSLGLGLTDTVFITIGRWNIQKDYYTLLRSLDLVKTGNIRFKMIMVGEDLCSENKELVKLIRQYNLEENIILLGRRHDIPKLLSAADIYISSSLGESFSNTIGEAMCCELTCVVTKVGHSSSLIDGCGIAVSPRNPHKLKEAIIEIIDTFDWAQIGKKARAIILKNYDIKKIVKSYESTYDI